MSVNPPVGPKKKSLLYIAPRISKAGKPKVAVKSRSVEDKRLIEKVKEIEFIREDRISEAKLKILLDAYESSHVLDSLAEKLSEELN